MLRSTSQPRHRRAGLTLIELLVVILIIGILMALLLPAVNGAFKAAKQGQVTAEINNLSTALADFKNKYGEYPPSRLYCSEKGIYPASDPVAQRSLQFLRKVWPRMALTTGTAAVPGAFYDFNGDGVSGILKLDGKTVVDSAYILNGPECLAFFLGGVPQRTISNGKVSFSMSGFDRNPSNPFTAVGTASTTNRIPPLFEFAPGRLDDGDLDPTAAVPNNVPCYLDPLGSGADSSPIAESNDKRPYAYFAAYGQNNYDPNDYNAASEVDSVGTAIGRSYSVSFQSTLLASVGPNPYTVTPPIVYATGSTTDYTSATYQSANTYQLFSAGLDRQWGIGGQYQGSGTNRLPFDPTNTANFYDKSTYVTSGDTGNPRTRENDNLSSFSGGRLN